MFDLTKGTDGTKVWKEKSAQLNKHKAEEAQQVRSQPIIAGARIRIWVGAIFWVPSEQTLERQILARVTFAPELGFIDSG